VRVLIDHNLAPRLATVLGEHGHDAVDTSTIGLDVASDATVLDWARAENRALVSADSDFGTILASNHMARPFSPLYPTSTRPASRADRRPDRRKPRNYS